MISRLESLRKLMSGNGAANLFVSSLSDIYYLTGFTGSTAYLFVTADDAVFVTDGRYTEQSKNEVQGCTMEIVQDYRKALEKYTEKMKDIHVTYSCALSDYEYMMENAASVTIDAKNLVGLLRMVKDEAELAQIREMFLCAKNAFHASLPSFQTGLSEVRWAAELEKNMKISGAKSPSFETIIASGHRGAMPHGIASEKIVEKGDAVVVDFGAEKEYCSDVTRLVKTGADKDVDMVADIVYTALRKAMDAVCPGVKCSAIDAVAREYIDSKGYGDFFNHGLGHGVGIDVHEKPVFNPRDETILEPGMVLTIEPGIYLPGKFGVRLEDTVAVKDDGCENLTAVFEKYIYEI